jgi:predicted RNA-binding protein with PUA-like domain
MTATKSYIYEGTGSATEDYFKPKAESQEPTATNWAIFDKTNKQHLTLLSQLRTLQWTVPSEKWGEVADLPRLSAFLKSPESPVKKPLKEMESLEVSKIIECFKSMIRKKYK